MRSAIEAAWTTDAGRRWGRATTPGYERDAGLSALLDFDDYGFLAHPGHSAAVVAGGHEEAHVAAGELALRLGAACLLSPSHGQGLAFVHAPAAALATGLRAGFNATLLARAMGLAFLAPATQTWGGLMGTRAKAAAIGEAVATGLRAAELAAAEVKPPRDALADGLATASFAPLTRLLDGLGERWLLGTLSFKPRPGSVYLQTALAAFADLGPIEREEVSDVEVAVGAATLTMEALARRVSAPADEPMATQFSVERSIRVALAYGDVTPETIERPVPQWPAVRLRHDPTFSRDTISSLERGAPLSRALLDLRPFDWLAVLVGLGRSYGRALRVPPAALGALRPRSVIWAPDELELVFPARVVVRLKDGSELVSERRLHPGQKGAGDIDDVIAAKRARIKLAA